MNWTDARGAEAVGAAAPSAVPNESAVRGTESGMPDFALSTGRGTLEASGVRERVSEGRAAQAAAEHESVVVGMLPFDPEGEPLLFVPERAAWTTRNEGPLPPFDVARPTAAHGLDSQIYRDAVALAVARIHEGTLDKVVLSRALDLCYDAQTIDPEAVYRNLLALYSTAYVFSVRNPSTGEYVMGASPELVVGAEDGRCSTHPLAGSSARRTADGPTEDAQAGEALLRSAKDRAEHATVVDDIAARLGPLCASLTVPPAPTLLATPQLWHLGTAMSGTLRPGVTALDAARAVHPTPAICGMPRNEALDLIREVEPYERGFYGGLVGWMDQHGNGEWALNLRSGRVGEGRATLCAGAGIVSGSTPQNEHHETAVKLSTFLAALGLDLDDVAAVSR